MSAAVVFCIGHKAQMNTYLHSLSFMAAILPFVRNAMREQAINYLRFENANQAAVQIVVKYLDWLFIKFAYVDKPQCNIFRPGLVYLNICNP